MLTLPKDCLSHPVQQNWGCHGTETNPRRSPPDLPATFQGASSLMCHRFGHSRASAEPRRGQGNLKQPLACTEKPFTSCSSVTPHEAADEWCKSVCQGSHADLCRQARISGNSHPCHDVCGLVSHGFNATLKRSVGPVLDAIPGMCFVA